MTKANVKNTISTTITFDQLSDYSYFLREEYIWIKVAGDYCHNSISLTGDLVGLRGFFEKDDLVIPIAEINLEVISYGIPSE